MIVASGRTETAPPVFGFDPIKLVRVGWRPSLQEVFTLVAVRQSQACGTRHHPLRASVPALRRLEDAPRVAVAALLAPVGEARRWRQWLRFGTPARRAAAVVALCTRDQTRVVLAVQAVLLGDGSAWVRRHAAYALGLLSGRSVARALVRALASEVDEDVRAALVVGLGRQPSDAPGVNEMLNQLALFGVGAVRANALLALHAQGVLDPALVAYALSVPCLETRRAAAVVAHHAAPHLLDAMRLDAEPTVARLAGAAV
jgi:HEAT repeat protein